MSGPLDDLQAYADSVPDTGTAPEPDALAHYAATGALPQSAQTQAQPKSGIGAQLWDALKSIPGSIAHQVGNLADITENEWRAEHGMPTIAPGGPQSRATRWSAQFAQTGNYGDIDTDIKQQKIASGDVNFQLPQGPFRQTLEEYGPQALEAAGTAASAGNMAEGALASEKAAPPFRVPSEMDNAVAEENARVANINASAQKAGFDLPESGSQARYSKAASGNQPLANQLIRDEFGLPPEARVSPEMMDRVAEIQGKPQYDAIRGIPSVDTNDAYHAARQELAGADVPRRFRNMLPDSDSISGADAVGFSQKFRFQANRYFREYNRSGSTQAFENGQLMRDAAEGVESSVKEHLASTGQSDMADSWDAGRTLVAKANDVANSVDGRGNINVSALVKLKDAGRPLTGNLKFLADLGEMHPEAFKLSPATAPSAGLLRQGAAELLPVGGAALGGLGGSILGPWGTAGGAAVGAAATKGLVNKIVLPQ